MLGLETGPFIVVLIRLLVPLSIFRWPLAGAIASVAADATDVVMLTIIGMGDFPDYTLMDKALDWYFLLFLAIASLKWASIEKWTSIGLFSYRTIGVILLEITKIRELLFIFPNLFILFYLFNAARIKYYPKWKLTGKRLVIVLLLLLIPKLLQEYLLHIVQVQPWTWALRNVFGKV